MRSIQALTFKALFPLGAVLVLGLVFYPQIVDSILFTPHPAIVFIIFGLMALGALLLMINLKHLATDHRAFLQVKVDVLNKGQEALQLLQDRTPAPDAELPDTGVGRVLASRDQFAAWRQRRVIIKSSRMPPLALVKRA